jgi:hypothetical protein
MVKTLKGGAPLLLAAIMEGEGGVAKGEEEVRGEKWMRGEGEGGRGEGRGGEGLGNEMELCTTPST